MVIGYVVLVLLVGVERLAELVVSTRHARASLARGGVEHGRGHYPPMVALHTGLLAGCVVEVLVADRPFVPLLGWPMLAILLLAQGLRWWCITTLGPAWSTRVIVVPGRPLVRHGPYRLMPHPNYLAVMVEGVALPMVHTAWVTALAFTAADAILLRQRIRVEDAALAQA